MGNGKQVRCFEINDITIEKAHQDVKDNLKPGDQYCEIIDSKTKEVTGASGGSLSLDEGEIVYEERANTGVIKDRDMARGEVVSKLKPQKRGLNIF
jgi:hypothetical protein